MIELKIKRLSNTAILPTYGSEKAAGMDLYADIGYHLCQTTEGMQNRPNFIDIAPHTTEFIHTGFAFQPPVGYCGKIYARSGLSNKQGLRPGNCVGICDEDYTGEYIVGLHNDNDKTRTICHGDRIAQLIFEPYVQANLIEVDSLTPTERGEGGFGSTGV